MLPLRDFERHWHMKRSSLIVASAVAAVLGLVATGWLAIEVMRGGNQSAMFKVGGPFVLAAARGGTVDSKTLVGKRDGAPAELELAPVGPA